ncbi:MAG TPA: AmpG family muropeptide MFS transporter [Alphaproteobacteria bacterium]|nr:AmpG family muropeptide MFS transporter [Alphaproteobacteria bacterium]
MGRSTIERWLAAASIYKDRRILAIALMGFSSGLPLALVGATLGVWLAEAHVSLTNIGFFALTGIAYNVKFLWSPVMDRAPLPWLTRRFGRRRGWALATQAALIVAILFLGNSDPGSAPGLTAVFAVLVAFMSASQDIVIDALRVDLLAEHEQGAGAAATQFGWRVGALVSGAGALYAASFGGWGFAYGLMAAFVLVGAAAVFLVNEPRDGAAALKPQASFGEWLEHAVIDPFADFMTRHTWAVILLFVVLYKFGDALAGVMSSPFYIAMGFTKIEIANISKIFGTSATILGVFLGGVVVYRWGAFKALLVCGVLQMLSNLMFAAQAVAGHDPALLIFTIGIENASGGMGSAAFVAYLSALCNAEFTATQYALLSSLAAVPRTFLASGGGWLAQHLGWVDFFLVSTAAALPGLLLLLWLMRRAAAVARGAVRG